MRKILFSVLALVFVAASSLYADEGVQSEEWISGLYVTGEGAAIIPFDGDLSVGAYGGGRVGYWWSEMIATEVQIGFASIDSDGDVFELDVIPLLVNLRADLPLELGWDLHAYIYGGIGVLFNDSDTVGLDIDDSFAGQIGAGLQYFFSENVSASVDARFLFSSPDVAVVGIAIDEDLDLNSFLIGGNLTIEF